MAVLKDSENRIASVKSKQKIHQAMKRSLWRKLRPRPGSGGAARPYAERIGDGAANLAARLSRRTGKDC